VKGLARAEWIRFRKRRSLQVIVLAIPLLVAFFFLAGYASLGDPLPPFDPAEVRARILAEGYLEGVPPEDAEIIIAETIEAERAGHEMALEQQALVRAQYAFPQSLVTVLGSGMFVFFALILLTATTVGDEFGWGTIRTVLIASSHRRRLLIVRLAALGVIAVGMLAILVALGTLLPAVLAATGARLPATPGFDAAALLVLLLGQLVISMAVIAFAALATLMVRSGSLTLVVMLVYVVIEAAILTLLLRFETFQDGGAGAWVLDAFPVRGIGALTEAASRAATGLAQFPGEAIVRDLGAAALPLVALFAWGVLFAAGAFRRFSRMDIVE
jgi:ABC-type transport system involved in multi-copper enzyme maturation permease subunit